jgi:hypothetical protein
MSDLVKVLHGHTSPESAHLTFVYPFGHTKCVRREWIERAVKGAQKGHYRFVTQTTVRSFNYSYTDLLDADGQEAANAWAEREIAASANGALWNAPKPGTYVFYAVMIQEPLPDGSGRLGTSYLALHPYDGPDRLVAFKSWVSAQLDPAERALLERIESSSRRANAAAWAKADAASATAAGEPSDTTASVA